MLSMNRIVCKNILGTFGHLTNGTGSPPEIVAPRGRRGQPCEPGCTPGHPALPGYFKNGGEERGLFRSFYLQILFRIYLDFT